MKLKVTLFIFMSALFVFFVSAIWVSFDIWFEKENQEIVALNLFNMLLLIGLFFLVALILVGFALNFFILHPINALKNAMHLIQKGHYAINPPSVGTGEIAELSMQFANMVEFVHQNNMQLEEKIKERTEGLLETEWKLNTILDSVDAYIYIKDTNYAYIYANKKTCDYIGRPLEEIVGKDDTMFFEETVATKLREIDRQVIEQGKKISHEEIIPDLKGHIAKAFTSTKLPLFREDGSIYALCGISTDITERKKTEEMIKNFAFYDSLTGLPNRRMLDDRLSFLLAKSKRTDKLGAVMFLDLDNFKPLNDTFGHQAGDILLIEMAKRLTLCVREVDTVARFGGDEFIVALGDLDIDEAISKKQVLKIANKILKAVSVPFSITVMGEDGTRKEITHACTASIGATLFQKYETNKDRIFQRADKAMYVAKSNGRNRVEFIQESQASQISEALKYNALY